VPIAHAALGTKLVVETPDGARNAQVVQMPFIDPSKSIAKG
jgi:glycine cleavage system aminomethyltransferase T